MKKIVKTVLWFLLALVILFGVGTWVKFRPLVKGALSVQKLDEGLYYMEYRGDDGFDELMAGGGGRNSAELARFAMNFLSKGFYNPPVTPDPPQYGCSSLTVRTPENGVLMGRNFDFSSATGVILHTVPKHGYETVTTFNVEFFGFGKDWLPEGFANQYMALSGLFFALDGINEKGLAIADLMAGDDAVTHQDTGKPALTTTSAICYLLKNAATVDEALELLRGIDMHSDIGSAHHYAISDASGKSVVVEYVDNEFVVVDSPACTNHYLCAEKRNVGLYEGDRRYDFLCGRYDEAGGTMDLRGLTTAIASVSQPPAQGDRLGTAWTMVMDLTSPAVTYYSRRHFDKPFRFELERKSQASSPKTASCGPVPTENQLRWQDMEMYAFIHYSLNTYTDQEWGFGNEAPALFNPSDLDCRQWARVCRQAGMKGIIFTAKHHCGFCMWPSAYTEYSVKNAPWKQGKGDVVRELADACREEGLKFAVYLSPWDRNHPDYGKPEYVTYFRNQLRELLTGYGDIFEVWFDGANGGDGWYGGANERRQIDRTTYYGWPETYRMVRELQPGCLIWNDGGDRGDLRWVGTEAGFVGETNWSLLNAVGDVPYEQLHYGLENGDTWVPGETNTSIRPGWFYHASEDGQVKSLSKLMDTYYKSVGRNSTLLLNFPIAPNGRIHPVDSLRGVEFGRMVREAFKTDLAAKAKVRTRGLETVIDFRHPTAFNRFVAEEDIRYGQRVKRFALEARVDGKWIPLKDELAEDGDGLTTIGHRRIICFPTVEADRLRFTVTDAKCAPLIKRTSVYLAPES